MTLPYLVLSWLLGIGATRESGIDWWMWLLLAIPAFVGWLIAYRSNRQRDKKSHWTLVMGCVLFFLFGAARLDFAAPSFDEGDLITYNEQGFVTVEGIIIDAPDIRETHVNLTVKAEQIILDEDEEPIPVDGSLLAQAPLVGEYRYGDPVTIRGELYTPPEDDDFSYRDYLAREDIYSLMRYTQVEVAGDRRGSPFRAAMLDFRTHAHGLIIKMLPDPQASLLAGILLGIESGISPDVLADFNAVGATHIIVISGANLVVIAGIIDGVTRRFLRKQMAGIVSIVGIIIYSIFVGGDSAVLRSTFMVVMLLLANIINRQTFAPASLAFAALAMTIMNPFTLWDVSFQLSALATLGLIIYVTPLENLLSRGLNRMFSADKAKQIVGAVSEAFVVTIAAQITTTAIIVYYFGRLSILSLPLNFMIIPLQTPLMILGGLGLIVAMIIQPLGQVILWGSWVFLSLTVWLVRIFARLPFASVAIEDINPGTIWGIYIMIFGITFFAQQDQDSRSRIREWFGRAFGVKAVASVGLVAAALIWSAVMALPDGKLHVTFVDVGNGSATLIETPSGRHILVDAGGSGRRLSTALGDSLPYWDRRIDLVILTQPDDDHTAALLPNLRRYQVDAVMGNGVSYQSDSALALRGAFEQQGTQFVTALPGTQIDVGDGVVLEIIYTQTIETLEEGDPGVPMVVMLTYGDARFLITGDLEPEDESALLASRYVLDSTVLLVPSQGRNKVSGEAFLEAVSPQIAILSVDTGNRYGLPHEETLIRLQSTDAYLYRTGQVGTIELITDGVNLMVRTAKDVE